MSQPRGCTTSRGALAVAGSECRVEVRSRSRGAEPIRIANTRKGWPMTHRVAVRRASISPKQHTANECVMLPSYRRPSARFVGCLEALEPRILFAQGELDPTFGTGGEVL